MEVLGLYDQAIDRVGGIVAGVRDDQWDDPTPCTEWNVRVLANHIVGGLYMFGTAASGTPVTGDGDPGDLLGDDAGAAYAQAGATARAGFRSDGVEGRTLTLPIGDLPAEAALAVALSDLVVHGWDLAKATGQPTDIPSPEVDVVSGIMHQSMGPHLRQPDGQFPVFGPEVPVDEDAAPTDRLVAFLGRRP